MTRHEIELPSDRTFGRVFAGLFLGLTAYAVYRGWVSFAATTGGVAVVLAGLAELRPTVLRHANYAWALLGLALGRIVGTAVLALIFFLLVTPIALVIRLIGRDELRLRPRVCDSHWRDRPADTRVTDFKEQY